MRRWFAVGALGLLLVGSARGQEPPAANARPTRANDATFEEMWTEATRAAASDPEAAARLMQTLRRARMDRNVAGLETVALAQVARGLDRLDAGDADGAAADFNLAIEFDPRLPEGYLGLARAELRQSPLNLVAAARDVGRGLSARLATQRGKLHAMALGLSASLLTGLAVFTVFAVCMLLRYGALVRHDIEELLGTETRRPLALGLYVALLAVPLLALQGYAWIPFWWLAVLWLHLRPIERIITAMGLVALLALGPALWLGQRQMEVLRNPLFRLVVDGVEGAGDERAIRELERARQQDPANRDVAYLLASQLRKAGRKTEAAAIYEGLLVADPHDAIAHNNLGNIWFVEGGKEGYAAAITHYLAGLRPVAAAEDAPAVTGPSPRVRTTLHYNLYLAYLLTFDYQNAQESRNRAEQIDRGLVQEYEERWRIERGGVSIAAAVDLGPTAEESLVKLRAVQAQGAAGDLGQAALAFARSLLNRFTAVVGLFGLVVLVRGVARGKKAFTLRCLKCGTPFCRRCHLGAAVAGLCTQCYHLFIVRDGVSGPARNRKLLEVQKEDERRERVFRTLSLISPGAGHIYGQKTVMGLLYSGVWYFLIAVTLLGLRLVSVSEAAARLAGPWSVVLAVVVLLLVYLLTNRGRLDFEVVVPVRRGMGRPRGR